MVATQESDPDPVPIPPPPLTPHPSERTLPSVFDTIAKPALTVIHTPIMGGLLITGDSTKTYSQAWTGGKPNITWTGLENPSEILINPTQTRGNDVKSTLAYKEREAGLYPGQEEQKFGHGDDLNDFCNLLSDKFLDMGMDTITYRKDPLDESTMIDILSDYPRLNKAAIKKQSIVFGWLIFDSTRFWTSL